MKHLLSYNGREKSFDIVIDSGFKTKYLNQVLSAASNLVEITIKFDNDHYNCSTLIRWLNKLNTNNLDLVQIENTQISWDQVLKLLHKFDNVHNLSFYECKISRFSKDMKINALTRFKLGYLMFMECDLAFKLRDLAQIMSK